MLYAFENGRPGETPLLPGEMWSRSCAGEDSASGDCHYGDLALRDGDLALQRLYRGAPAFPLHPTFNLSPPNLQHPPHGIGDR